MKKKIIIGLLILFVILNIPIRYALKDGGSVVYKSILWEYTKVNAMNAIDGYDVGVIFKIFGITVIDDVREEYPDLTGKNNDIIDKNYDYNTSFSLDRTVWKSEDGSLTYHFNDPNVLGGCDAIISGVTRSGAYYLYTGGKEFEQYESFFNSSKDSLKDNFNSEIDEMEGIPFGLCVDLIVNKSDSSNVSNQSLFEYYGIYTKDKIVIVEIGSDDNVIVLDEVNG